MRVVRGLSECFLMLIGSGAEDSYVAGAVATVPLRQEDY